MISPASNWQIYRTRFLVKAKQLDSPLVFTDPLGREHRGVAGDYLVESSDGLQRIAPREIFEDIYVPMGPAHDSWPVPHPHFVETGLQAETGFPPVDASTSRFENKQFPDAAPSRFENAQFADPAPLAPQPQLQQDQAQQHQLQPHYQLHQQQQIYEPVAASPVASVSNPQSQLNRRTQTVNQSFVA